MTGCSRVFELLDTPIETYEPAEPKPMPLAKGEIRFDNVTFGYERHRPVLTQVDFTIRPGERIGIVGRSGSGKTTLVNLISRFYDVDSGRVLLDGVDVRELSTGNRRRHIGVVLQEPFLFRGTICDNLTYGRPEASALEAIAVARAAQAHDFILHKPLGYDTWLGERGAGLSGGEKQHVSIARALLYDPRVLILDVATSSVDTESEKAIQEALRVLTRGRTTLAIAHRLSTLCDSDRILVFDQGRLIEQATHDELLALDARYARLVKSQTEFARKSPFETALKGPGDDLPEEPSSRSAAEDEADFAPHWIEPDTCEFREGPLDSLEFVQADGSVIRSVFAVQCLPASEPDDFISLRTWDRDGQERELGILRNLNSWSAHSQKLVRDALGRRYFLRRITGIDDIKLECGYLLFAVRTDHGPARFTMRWTQSQVQDFGARGKVLLDVEDNRFLVIDIDELPPREREVLLRCVYW